MVIVPERGAPVVFASTLKLTLPSPDPGEPPVTVIHGALLTAVQVHPPGDITDTVPGPPAAVIVVDAAPSVNVHPESCETVSARPAIVTVPLRVGPVCACASTCTVPGPDPLAPDTTANHGALLTAVHAHDAAAPTDTITEPPVAGTVCANGLTVNEQPLP